MRHPSLILGTAQLTTNYGVRHEAPALSLPHAAALLGAASTVVDGFDTAPAYGDAELAIGASGVDGPVYTKLDPVADPARSLAASLARLGRPHVTGVFLHDPDVVLDDPDGTLDRAHALVGRGAGFLGASVYSPAQFEAALADHRITGIQVPLSVADRRPLTSGLLAAAAERGVPVFVRSAYLQGALLLAPDRLPPHLVGLVPVVGRARACADELGRRLSSVLLAYVRDVPGVAGVVLGAETIEQVRHNAEDFDAGPLPDEWRAAFDAEPLPSDDIVDPRRWP